jgi:hypothetical protein
MAHGQSRNVILSSNKTLSERMFWCKITKYRTKMYHALKFSLLARKLSPCISIKYTFGTIFAFTVAV